MQPSTRRLGAWGAAGLLATAATTGADNLQFSAAGDAATVQASLDAFRAALGPNNGGNPGSFGGGRREINWDGVSDALSSPNAFPGDFFNAATAPRARGALCATDGDHLEVSAKTGNPTATPVEFGNIDASYPGEFAAFSPQRLFAPIGSTTTTVEFFVPGTVTEPAQVTGFGAIFTDVDGVDTSITAYDGDGEVLGIVEVPSVSAPEQFSFAGILITAGNRIAKVEITTGSLPLGAGNVDAPRTGDDVVALDDFIYGEPTSLHCPYDLTGDGAVDGPDLGILLGAWGVVGATPADINLDGTVDAYDLAYVLGGWGPCVD